jgi:hypothetical protein
MEHVLQDLARDRHQRMLAAAEAGREANRVRRHSRVSRRAERAERRVVSQWDQAHRLRAHLIELESAV